MTRRVEQRGPPRTADNSVYRADRRAWEPFPFSNAMAALTNPPG